jgi:hypothetical protein
MGGSFDERETTGWVPARYASEDKVILLREDRLRIAAMEAASRLAAHYPRWGRPTDLADEILAWLKAAGDQ